MTFKEECKKIMKIELKNEWKLDLRSVDWKKGDGWEGDTLKESKTILIFKSKEADCIQGFLHELTHAIEIEQRPDKKHGCSHDVHYAATLTDLIGKYALDKAKVKEVIDNVIPLDEKCANNMILNNKLKKELGLE